MSVAYPSHLRTNATYASRLLCAHIHANTEDAGRTNAFTFRHVTLTTLLLTSPQCRYDANSASATQWQHFRLARHGFVSTKDNRENLPATTVIKKATDRHGSLPESARAALAAVRRFARPSAQQDPAAQTACSVPGCRHAARNGAQHCGQLSCKLQVASGRGSASRRAANVRMAPAPLALTQPGPQDARPAPAPLAAAQPQSSNRKRLASECEPASEKTGSVRARLAEEPAACTATPVAASTKRPASDCSNLVVGEPEQQSNQRQRLAADAQSHGMPTKKTQKQVAAAGDNLAKTRGGRIAKKQKAFKRILPADVCGSQAAAPAATAAAPATISQTYTPAARSGGDKQAQNGAAAAAARVAKPLQGRVMKKQKCTKRTLPADLCGAQTVAAVPDASVATASRPRSFGSSSGRQAHGDAAAFADGLAKTRGGRVAKKQKVPKRILPADLCSAAASADTESQSKDTAGCTLVGTVGQEQASDKSTTSSVQPHDVQHVRVCSSGGDSEAAAAADSPTTPCEASALKRQRCAPEQQAGCVLKKQKCTEPAPSTDSCGSQPTASPHSDSQTGDDSLHSHSSEEGSDCGSDVMAWEQQRSQDSVMSACRRTVRARRSVR